MNNDNTNLNHHDPEIDSLIKELDSLSAMDQKLPDDGFEQRIMDSISATIAPAPLVFEKPAQPTTSTQPPQHGNSGWKIQIAALFLVAASVTALIWSSTQTSQLPAANAQPAQQSLVSLEEDFDALFDLTDFGTDIDTDLDQLDLLTDAMHTELSMPSVLMELSESSFTEGSL
ncbi:MAG: hypothetical protein AB8C13_05440 [Phycisphaerales bacterium]